MNVNVLRIVVAGCLILHIYELSVRLDWDTLRPHLWVTNLFEPLRCVHVFVCRVDPEGDVSGLLGASGLRVSTVDEEFGQQLWASQERSHECLGRLLELRDGEDRLFDG